MIDWLKTEYETILSFLPSIVIIYFNATRTQLLSDFQNIQPPCQQLKGNGIIHTKLLQKAQQEQTMPGRHCAYVGWRQF